MGWRRALIWRLLAVGWVAGPLCVPLPYLPPRISTAWLWQWVSCAVVAWALVDGVGSRRARPFGVAALVVLGLAVTQLAEPTGAFVWATRTILVLAAAGCLAARGVGRWLRQAVIGSALVQLVVGLLAWGGVPLPWVVSPDGLWWGTLGSETPVAVLLGLACLWSTDWKALGFGVATLLTGSGTAIPLVLLRLVWPTLRRLETLGLSLVVSLVIVGFVCWRDAWLTRWAVWQDWPLSFWGGGFATFPSGFADDTALGRHLGWRDYHSVWLDGVARFGVLGFAALAAVVRWLWRHARGWTLAFALWVGTWQSAEQFPMLMVVLCAWLIHEGGRQDAVDSV